MSTDTTTRSAATYDADAERALQRAQDLSEALERLPDGQARQVGEDVLGTMLDLYGEGLRRILGIVDGAGAAGRQVREGLAADGVVASLLLIHDLHPVPLAVRVQEALDSVRPYMESHGGNVDILGVHDGVVRLKLQ